MTLRLSKAAAPRPWRQAVVVGVVSLGAFLPAAMVWWVAGGQISGTLIVPVALMIVCALALPTGAMAKALLRWGHERATRNRLPDLPPVTARPAAARAPRGTGRTRRGEDPTTVVPRRSPRTSPTPPTAPAVSGPVDGQQTQAIPTYGRHAA